MLNSGETFDQVSPEKLANARVGDKVVVQFQDQQAEGQFSEGILLAKEAENRYLVGFSRKDWRSTAEVHASRIGSLDSNVQKALTREDYRKRLGAALTIQDNWRAYHFRKQIESLISNRKEAAASKEARAEAARVIEAFLRKHQEFKKVNAG